MRLLIINFRLIVVITLVLILRRPIEMCSNYSSPILMLLNPF